jgi:phytoene dehydrogenase-like protein
MIDHDPAWAWLGPDGQSLVLSRDVETTIREIATFSPRDAATYRDFIEAALGALAIQDGYGAGSAIRPSRSAIIQALKGLSRRPARALLGAVLSSSAAELIEDTFVSTELRGAFASMASILGSISLDSSGVGLLATAPLHRYGVSRPIGGMQAIPDALERCLVAQGGTVSKSCPAEQILIGGSGVEAVRTADGRYFPADYVVAAVPPQVTARLLADSGTSGLATLRHAPSNAAGMGCFKLDLALDRHVALEAHQPHRGDDLDLRKPTLFYGSFEQVLRAEGEARGGIFPSDPPWTATILSARDPSQAPAGQDTLYTYAPAPVRPHGGWAEVRSEAERRLLYAVSNVLTNVDTSEIGRVSETPEDLERRLGATNGCIYHVDQLINRLGPLRPGRGWAGHRTRVPGLFVSGAGTHPGGGVSGIPGQLAARAVLRSHRSRSKELNPRATRR